MDELDPWAPVDPLGRALHLLRMNGAFYCRSELTAIGTAIGLVHADPARDWTVASLAAELSMSRSAFAARFTSSSANPRCST